MKRAFGSVVAGLALILATLSVCATEPTKSEVDGKWEAVHYNDKGKDDKELVQAKFLVGRDKGSQTIWREGKVWKERLYSVNQEVKPKQIEWRDPKDRKITALGIYQIDGDTMTVAAYVDEAKKVVERPKDFTPAKDKVVVSYRRVKAK